MPWERRDEDDPSGFEIQFNFSVFGKDDFGFVDLNESQNLRIISENVFGMSGKVKMNEHDTTGSNSSKKVVKELSQDKHSFK